MLREKPAMENNGHAKVWTASGQTAAKESGLFLAGECPKIWQFSYLTVIRL
jgi:hypothetical protein